MFSGSIKLACAALLMVAAVALVYLAEKRTALGRIRPWARQLVIGVIFGGLAVMGTEFGVQANGATLNVRDAAPLCAGLIFGAPAGIIAGLIGGVERWFAVYWGAGAYTRLACSLSTVMAGLLAAALRRHMFDNKKPSWFYGLAVGLVMEVLHMLMIFLTHMNDVSTAFTFVELCALPMIAFNGLAVMLAVLTVTLMARERLALRKDQRKLAAIFQRWLLVCVTAAFLCTCVFVLVLQTCIARGNATSLMRINIDDVYGDIRDASDVNLLGITRLAAGRLNAAAYGSDRDALLAQMAEEYEVSEIDVIDDSGVIVASTEASYVGFDMAGGEQSAAFLALLGDAKELVQAYQPMAFNEAVYRKYAGVALLGGGFVQVGYDAERFQRDLDTVVVGAAHNRHIGENGYLMILDENGRIRSDGRERTGTTLSDAGARLPAQTDGLFELNLYGESSLCLYAEAEGYGILAVMPRDEVMRPRDISAYMTAFMEIILFAALFTMIYFLLKRQVVRSINSVNQSLGRITGGDLSEEVRVRSSEEFASLSEDINMTVDTLKGYIAEAAARLDRELELARSIQHSALPSVFPPYPNRGEFDLYALMNTAKEVGGDFYDFYFLDEDHLAFLIADVSGKGVPAALFMMTAKTTLKGQVESRADLADAVAHANARLCEGNDAGMFVTAWQGVLDVRAGLVTYVNAGHNPPLVRHADGAFEYLRGRGGFVLAGVEGVRYRTQTLQLLPGDALFLYTDGVTEATDAAEQLYGEDRLLAALNASADADAQTMTARVQADVERFVGEAPQFDDITMLALRYLGGEKQ